MEGQTFEPNDLEKFYAWGQTLTGHAVPRYVAVPLGWLILAALILVVILSILTTIAKIKECYDKSLGPLLYSEKLRQKTKVRRQFAKYLLHEIRLRNLTENWRDEEFTELEAEVEAEGSRRASLLGLWDWQRRGSIRRERSLSVALERSVERLILVEGDPGVGKSVALRHVAYRMAEKAASSRQSNRKLPVYINLKELKRNPNVAVDHSLISSFVRQSMNRLNDRFVDEFVLAEFDNGIRDGLWVFLFDSFDEIPDILSSTEQDDVIAAYTSAISNFLSGINECRGVVASRYYRGPSRQDWKTFRVLELSRVRQRLLMRRALPLKLDVAERLEQDLLGAPDDIQVMARNPMLLQLLCEHAAQGYGFPSSSYEVFSSYLQHRFARDEERVKARLDLDAVLLRRVAEQVGFVMTADASLGLSPLRAALPEALVRHGFLMDQTDLYRVLDALEYMRIARSALMGGQSTGQQFTFSHRRFQEYFATCVVIREVGRVPAATLLSDARWRETAVALCQTGQGAKVRSLIEVATGIVEEALAHLLAPVEAQAPDAPSSGSFEWPAGLLHVLGILQAGFVSVRDVPDSLREAVGRVLTAVWYKGDLLDRKFALEVAGVANEASRLVMIRDALATDSQLIADAAYGQVARLASLPDDISLSVRNSLLRLAARGQLARNRTSIRAFLSRLPGSGAELRSAARLAVWLWPIDAALYPFCIALIVTLGTGGAATTAFMCGMVWVLGSLLYRWLSHYPAGLSGYFVRFPFVLDWLVTFLRLEVVALSAGAASIALLGFGVDLGRPGVAGGLVAVAAGLFCAVWPVAASACVRDGRWTSILYWPLAPLLAGGLLLRSVWRTVWRAVRKDAWGVVKWCVCILAIYAAIVAMFVVSSNAGYGLVTAGVFLVFGGAITVLPLIAGCFVEVRERAKLGRWQRGRLGCVDGVALAVILGELRSGRCRCRLISLAGSLGAFVWDSAGERALRQLASEFGRPEVRAQRLGALRRLTVGNPFYQLVFPDLRAECRDQICRLLEGEARARAVGPPLFSHSGGGGLGLGEGAVSGGTSGAP